MACYPNEPGMCVLWTVETRGYQVLHWRDVDQDANLKTFVLLATATTERSMRLLQGAPTGCGQFSPACNRMWATGEVACGER
jgi:hypothetical protein